MPRLLLLALLLLVSRPAGVAPAPGMPPAVLLSAVEQEAHAIPPRPGTGKGLLDWEGFLQKSMRYRIMVDSAENRTVVVACLGGSATAGGGGVPKNFQYGNALRGTFSDMRSPKVEVLSFGHGTTNTMCVSFGHRRWPPRAH